MAGRIIPETDRRPDWPRLVAQGHKDHEGRIAALENPLTITFTPTTAPASPSKGTVYYDSGTNKLRCWDGTAWYNLW